MDDERIEGIQDAGLDDDNPHLADWEKLLQSIIEDHERRAKITNFPRFLQMKEAYNGISKMFAGNPNVSVTYSLKKMMRSMGVIRVEGDMIDVNDTGLFSKFAAFANSVDVYPLTNGRVRMAFTFNDITTPIE